MVLVLSNNNLTDQKLKNLQQLLIFFHHPRQKNDLKLNFNYAQYFDWKNCAFRTVDLTYVQ